MDPNQAWLDLSTAVAEAEWERASEIAGDLGVWLERGGFPPTISGHPHFDKIVAKSTCQAIFAWEIA